MAVKVATWKLYQRNGTNANNYFKVAFCIQSTRMNYESKLSRFINFILFSLKKNT